jgi:transaldolase
MSRKISIFYDGLAIEKYASDPKIEGFTTNCSIFAKGPYPSYRAFWDRYRDTIGDRPLSLQVWKDTTDECIKQVQQIHQVSPQIFVKVPIVNTRGEYNEEVIQYAVKNQIRLNITAIHTLEQIEKAAEFTRESKADEIISIFGGPISDTFADPGRFIAHAARCFQGKAHTQILWAGCRELYTIKRAEEYGCDIITIPDAMMDRLPLLSKSLDDLTTDRTKIFNSDAEKGSFTIL